MEVNESSETSASQEESKTALSYLQGARNFYEVIQGDPSKLKDPGDLDKAQELTNEIRKKIENCQIVVASSVSGKRPNTETTSEEDIPSRPTKKPKVSKLTTSTQALTKDCNVSDLQAIHQRVHDELVKNGFSLNLATEICEYFLGEMVIGAVGRVEDFVTSYNSRQRKLQGSGRRALELAQESNVPQSVRQFYTKFSVRDAVTHIFGGGGTQRASAFVRQVERIIAEVEVFTHYKQVKSDLLDPKLAPKLKKYFMRKGVQIDEAILVGSPEKNAATIARLALTMLLNLDREELNRLLENIRPMARASEQMGSGLAFLLPLYAISKFGKLGVKKIDIICGVVKKECPEWLALLQVIEERIAKPYLRGDAKLKLEVYNSDSKKTLSVAEVVEAMVPFDGFSN